MIPSTFFCVVFSAIAIPVAQVFFIFYIAEIVCHHTISTIESAGRSIQPKLAYSISYCLRISPGILQALTTIPSVTVAFRAKIFAAV